jgi:hypothetical protein
MPRRQPSAPEWVPPEQLSDVELVIAFDEACVRLDEILNDRHRPGSRVVEDASGVMSIYNAALVERGVDVETIRRTLEADDDPAPVHVNPHHFVSEHGSFLWCDGCDSLVPLDARNGHCPGGY